MSNQINYTNLIKAYAKDLEARIAFLEQKQIDLPTERIKFVRRGDNAQYYMRHPNHKIQYLSKKDKSKLPGLINAHYIRRTLPKLKKNYKAAQSFLRFHSGIEEFQLAESLPLQMQKQNNNLYLCRKQAIERWQARPYKRNPYMPENLIHSSDRGEKMRSKSEVLISNRLFARPIPYKPEAPVFLKTVNKNSYPDFLMLNPYTLEEVIWEHFGLMSDPEYARNACRKIQIYADNGYIIGKNFIASFESEGAPLTTAYIDMLITSMFGPK